ncbi:MAG TPA: DUF349 domain-containing protein [Steroidobacteraceae bacterium]|nr:DUF349 domain-containing protein [Steroidobacteraceae bacterium]
MRIKRLARPLSRLFGTAPDDSPTALDSIAGLDSVPPQRLSAAAHEDGDETLRAAAIGKLMDGESLRSIAGLCAGTASGVSASLERAAQERLAQLIDEGALDFETLRGTPANVSALLAVAGYTNDPERLPRTLASIDEAERRALVLGGPSSRIRQLAAQSVSDPIELRQLLKQLHGKDKNVYKIIREKCDALHAVEQTIDKARNEAIRACESLERHAHRIYEAVYEPTLRHFHTRWQAFEAYAAPDMRERAARAIERCEEIIAEHHERIRQEAAEAAARTAREAERAEALRLAECESARAREEAERTLAETAARREAEETARAAAAAAEAAALREVNALIGKAHAALREGATGRASGLRRALEEKLAALAAVPPAVSRQVQKLDTSLGELKAWKEHAVAPKRAALIQEMESLIGAALEPQTLAGRIRQLQEDWKTVSKGVLSDSDADWQRFHQAAERAYQPCREHFEAQTKLRQANAEKRRAILERLRIFEAAHSGENADRRAFVTVLREAPLEWRRHFPVERAVARELQKEFDAAIGRLQGRLEAWHASNAEGKRSLIRHAAGLVDLQDGREATEAVKRLQAQWKELGAAAPDQERVLWEEFRGHCDAVFHKRQQAHTDYTASLQSNKARAVALCEEAEHLAGRSGADLLDAAAKMAEWRAAFEAVGELPREERGLKGRFERALERVKASISAQRARDKERSLEDLLEAASRIHAYGRAVSQAAPVAEREALKQAAEIYIAGVSRWPKGGAEALADAWGTAAAAKPLEAAHEIALRMLCVRGEILIDLPTPVEDQELRRDYQMRRLVERMGRGNDGADDSVESLSLEWTRSNSAPEEVYQSLFARFNGSLRSARSGASRRT